MLLIIGIFVSFLFNKSAAQSKTISLSSDNASLCQPALFQWVVNNAPTGSNYVWDFGNGLEQGRDTFYAYIKNAGKVSVSVKVTFPDKTVHILTKPNFVEVFAKPIPNYYASRIKLCDGADTVTYFDITPNSVKRSWVIDGSNYNNVQKKLTHPYASAGIKQLSLVVEDKNGCTDIKEFDTVAIIYKDVILDFSADNTSGCVVKKVKFTPIINTNGNKIISYKWEFPGGETLNQFLKDPDTVVFNKTGIYSPSIEVKAENGCIHKFTKQNYLAFGKIENIDIIFSDTAVCKGNSIRIENSNNNLPGVFKWTLPGTTTVTKSDAYTCRAKYDTLGKYDVMATYENNGCSVSKLLKNIIRVKGVKANFTSDDYYHCKFPHTVNLKNLSQSYEPGDMTYNWSVTGNSQSTVSTKKNLIYSVTQSGYYDVMLVTTHSNGCSDTFKRQNYIRNNKILPAFDAAYKVGCVNQFIEFNQATPPSSYMASDKFKWTFYDKDTSKILGYSNLTSPKFSYPDTGLYTVKMVADNGIGCKDSITKLKFIDIVIPKIAFKIPNPIICKNEILLGYGKSEPNRAKFSYFWFITNKSDANETYIKSDTFKEKISKAGEYNLKFVHEINKGCRDSIINNNLVKINGITAQMRLDTFNGCVPLTVNPQLTIAENFHFINSSNTIKYHWWASPSQNVVIINDSTFSPKFNFNKRGEYTINLEVTNSDGCTHTISSQLISVGVIADFKINDYIVCAGQNVILTNQSKLNPNKIKWLLDKDAITSNPDYQNEITIKYKTNASHTIGLIANKLDFCYDTVYRNINSILVVAEMSALQPILKCAPVYAQFTSTSKNADSLKWDFGDGLNVTTKDFRVGHIYRTNTGILQGFNTRLIAKSNEGCSDTLYRNNYIKVLGPSPSFEIIKNEGCEPLNVEFKNTSRDYFKHYMNYDDGSPLDTVIRSKKYSIITDGVFHQEFHPRLYAIDSLGCKAVFTSPVNVIVKKNPTARFSLSDSIVCEKQSIALVNKADSITNSDFYLIKLNEPLLLSKPEAIIYNAGKYQIAQVVKNLNDCFDTIKHNVVVFPTPKANFNLTDSLCQFKVLNFQNKSTGVFPIVNYKWELISGSNSKLYKSNSVKHVFNDYGPASISLTVTDTNKCTDRTTLYLIIPNPANIPAGDLKLVSVNFDSSIQVVSNPTNFNRFLLGNFYNSNNLVPIHTTNSKMGIEFDYYKKSISDSATCFDLRTLDICGYESGEGKKHCTMFLKVASNKAYTNQLNWSAYIGWPTIDNYTIYRQKQGESQYNLLTTLSSDMTSYLDSGLCNLPYKYYITATLNTLKSQSNTVTNSPKFIFPPKFSDVKNVSVIDNNTIKIDWKASNNLYFKNYNITRTNQQTSKVERFYSETNLFIDKDNHTSSNNYTYQISETDKCGNQSQPKYDGKNIVLNIDINNYKSYTHWNTYKTWKSGVKEYQLQLEKEGSFKTIYTSSNMDSSFIHDQTLEKINGPYCYRIMAVSGDAKDTSLSNISCIISPSKLFFPNAFSPNGDGVNDKISVHSLFVENNTNFSGRNFTLEIFNRWGEQVYVSQSINDEWDGMYKGTLIQSGVYMYQLKAMGVDNRSYSLKGTITIVE